ncbi:HTTM domain-containing protein [Ekhidna sp.]|uniref:HTTM domain-containing protein n=1 Tax=Ekhidna sp. TaxID=2608089 RepID=UPI003B5023CD
MSYVLSYRSIINYLEQPISIAPLVVFRIAFGLLMLFSTIRYMAMGWVDTQLINPSLHFSYYGFDWVNPLPGQWMYLVFVLMTVSAVAITLGAFYRLATALFFMCFSYVELIDITYYLNHYYFVSIVSFLLIFVPANSLFSVDAKRKPHIKSYTASLWTVGVFKLQIAIVYIYAGLAKINYDWLIKALPLSIWLPAKTSIPVIGWIFKFKATAYIFSWLGMLFDTFIVFGLMWKKTRWLSYAAVVFFHTVTGILFQIGIFPVVMIFAVTIFFSASFHERLLNKLSVLIGGQPLFVTDCDDEREVSKIQSPSTVFYFFLLMFFTFQVLFPWRYLLYSGKVFWTEEGYRFAWRVMLMEKAGTATFYVKDGPDGREGSVINSQFLNMHQEKQMSMQPDLILQFAHYLEQHFLSKGMTDPQVRVEAYVTLNAGPAQQLIDSNIDLTQIEDGWRKKTWVKPYNASMNR